MGDATYDTFERSQTVGKLTTAATTGYREIELQAPVTFIIGCLQRGNEGGIGHAFEYLGGLSLVLTT